MNDDIVARLRDDYQKTVPLCAEAADEIERLRAELADERERANILDIAFCDIADEMGVEPDNEGMLIWVDGIKSEHNHLRAERDAALERANRAEAVVETFVAYQVKNEGLIVGPRMWADLLTEAEYVLALNKGGGDE